VADAYVSTGSHIILTNTFQASRMTLERYDLGDKSREINMRGVEISKTAAGDRALVFASIGPCGKMLVTGDTTESELGDVFGEQAAALAEAGADGIVVETMIDVAEARIAAAAAKQTGLPVVASVVFDAGKDKNMTMMGNSIEEAVETLSAVGVDAVGANCGQGIEGFLPICRRMRQLTELPIWIKPNAGMPEIVDEQTIFRTTAAEFGRFVPGLLDGGANFIGACCGSDETFIAEICRIAAARQS
jgi:methionine synthase I (cobalamin-dependent)